MPKITAPDGTQIYYTDTGRGQPILCLPGLTRNTADFDHVAPHLSGRIIRMDYRGRGQSDWADPATYTIPQEAQDVLALLDSLELERVSILGTSRGGLIAMTLAATNKDRLSGVALNDIGPEIESTGLQVIKDYLGVAPKEATLAEAAEARARLWTDFPGVPMDRWMAEVSNHYEQTPSGLTLRYDPALREAVTTPPSSQVDLWPFFDALSDLPVALIRGVNSSLLSRQTATEMARRRPDMIWAEVPDRGHVPFLDEPEALAALAKWQDALQ